MLSTHGVSSDRKALGFLHPQAWEGHETDFGHTGRYLGDIRTFHGSNRPGSEGESDIVNQEKLKSEGSAALVATGLWFVDDEDQAKIGSQLAMIIAQHFCLPNFLARPDKIQKDKRPSYEIWHRLLSRLFSNL